VAIVPMTPPTAITVTTIFSSSGRTAATLSR
jgi:hypothetical protein